ncbi:putative quinol monooxygenase [Oceanispirochaeta sp.]|jgi:quinol monooxygenase YgiN|uniref:putative quinol monooxygenase n=1 Tax=Oceanispirochaeta sp. TaxID=2035350 RepID=UPI00260F442C|nr:putative quinol monooxygenase [Oceanispirochaeta sp.]MDA3958592.1 putative quinol monooxygenase [Oceanispirochaeta sp.]
MIGIIAEFDVKKESIDAFLAEVKPLVAASNAEEGCIAYGLHKAQGSENLYTMIEEWKDQPAIDEHNRSPHLTEIGPKLKILLNQNIKVTLYDKVL